MTNNAAYFERANMLRMFGEEYLAPNQRKYISYSLGWMYRSQELSAAFARSQLKRLDETNAIAQRNAKYLDESLNDIRYLTTPYVPDDRTHVYHKYRVLMHPEKFNQRTDPVTFRDAVLDALQKEGVEVQLWQTIPLSQNPLFLEKKGYGKGCPWTCRHNADQVDYQNEQFPATQHVIDNSLVIGSAYYPLYPQRMELMKYYSEAIHSVFDNLDIVLDKWGRKESR